MRILRALPCLVVMCLAVSIAQAQTWTKATTFPGTGAGSAWLMTDGTVIVHEEQSGATNWWKLTPTITGSYALGTWTQIASPPAGYVPIFFASQVLPDGRLLIEGGEYNNGTAVWTNLGAIYDPRTGQWTAVNPPAGWTTIGDAQSVILSRGVFMLANCCTTQEALFNATTLTWTATGGGKHDINDEEGWTLLPSGKLLTVDAYVSSNSCGGNTATELYTPSTGTWACGPTTPSQQWDNAGHEMGPAVLRPDGTVFQTGAVPTNAVYNSVTNTWVAAQSFPGTLDIADGPGALEINGKVLLMTSPGEFQTGAVFFEASGTSVTQITGPPNAPNDSSFYGHFLILPTGKIMFTDYSTDVELFGSSGTFNAAWRPTITTAPSTVTHGVANYTVSGLRFAGMSQGAAYGDDYQSATNYALVRLTNLGTGHVFYAKTHNQSSYQVQSATTQSTMFDVPSNTELGPTTLEVVTNGIPSLKKTITVN